MPLPGPAAFLVLLTTALHAQIPAFPGAEGFGAHATGGRGGDVYHVTNLNNNGAGSLRAGLNTVPAAGRTIVFAVSGYIPVVSDTNFNVPSKVTIAGQTAPGDGVGLRGGRMLISGSDVIIRHFRVRHGKSGTGGDCLNIDGGAKNTMLDHISLMFSTDENFSFFKSSVNDFTMQYSNSTWGMERHNAGGLWDLQNGSCHHTLWAHHRTRNPKARPGMLEWVNNVTFHWRNEGFIMGDSQTPANWKANVRGCYYISIDDADDGSVIKNTGLTKATVASNGVPNFSLHLNDTFFDNNADGILNGTDRGYGIVSGSEFTPGDAVGANRYYKSATPFAGATGSAAVTVDDALTGYKKVISSGAPLRLDANYSGKLRDELDTLLVDSVVNQYSILVQKDGKVAGEDPNRTSNGEQLLADQYGITNNGFGTLNGTTPPTDSDLDGMPDLWELTLNGLNAISYNVAVDDHNNAFTAGQIPSTFLPPGSPMGYTYLEEYLHFLAVPHATVRKSTSDATTVQVIDLRKYTDAFSKSPAFSVANVRKGSTQQFLADGITPSVNGPIVKFIPTLNAVGRGGFNFSVVDADGSQWTQQFALLISAIATPRDLLWKGDGISNTWDSATPNWQTTGAAPAVFSVGDTALLDDRGSNSPSIKISGNQTAGSVLITGTRNYAFGGSGSISSTGTLTKAGDTTLTLATTTSFSAGTYLNGGITRLSQPATLDGGTIRFTGGATLDIQHGDSSYFSLNPGIHVAAGATGNINLSKRSELNGTLSGGGTFNIFSPSNLGSEGRAYLDGASADCTGSVNLSGGATAPGNAGRLAFRAINGSFNGFPNARINLSGIDIFTANYSGGNSYALGELSGDANSRLRSNYQPGGGATTWSVGALGTDTTFAGEIMDGMSPTQLIKGGDGTFTLSGTNSYTGTTTVNSGKLRVTGALGPTTVTVGNGASLSGAATLGGSLTLAGGSTVDPGNAPGTVGTVNVANGLTLSPTCKLLFDLSSDPNGANDRIDVQSGTLSQNGAINFTFNATDGFLGAGTYFLITGAPTSSASGPVLAGNFPSTTRQTFTLARSSTVAAGEKSIWLTVGGNAGNLLWTGSNSIWDLASATSWSGGPAGDNRFYNLDTVTFDNNAVNRTVTLTGSLHPAQLTVDNSGAAYTFSGGGNLAGNAIVTKRGTGTLTLSNTTANSHNGGTFIEQGTLALGNNSAGLGSGKLHLLGGTLSLPGSATFLSNSIVISANSAISSSNNGNSTLLNSTANTLTSIGNPTLSLAGVAGMLSINGTMDGFSGTISFGSGSGNLRLNSNSSGSADVNHGSPNALFDLGSGSATLNNRNGGITLHLGAVSGGANTHLSGRQSGNGQTSTTCYVGELGTDATFAGSISNGGDQLGFHLIKSGGGKWTLSGTSSYHGSLTVVAGTIALPGSLHCSQDTEIVNGATLEMAGGSLTTASLNLASGAAMSGPGTLVGELVNHGTITGLQGNLTVTGGIVNHGVIRLTKGSQLIAEGPFQNFGILDLLTASGPIPPNLENYGVVIDSTGLRITSMEKQDMDFSVTIVTYPNHTYQFQKSDSLTEDSWSDIGEAVAGDGTEKSFRDQGGASLPIGFYRIAVDS